MDLEKWNKTREKRSEAGRKGGKQTQANQANDSLVKQTQANQAVNVNDNVNVNVNDNVINIPPISPKGDKPKKNLKQTLSVNLLMIFGKRIRRRFQSLMR